MALRTRSTLSRTARSGSPTRAIRGNPRDSSDTSTSQRTASIPCSTKLGTVTSMRAILAPPRLRAGSAAEFR
jgi:hypothetical protein